MQGEGPTASIIGAGGALSSLGCLQRGGTPRWRRAVHVCRCVAASWPRCCCARLAGHGTAVLVRGRAPLFCGVGVVRQHIPSGVLGLFRWWVACTPLWATPFLVLVVLDDASPAERTRQRQLTAVGEPGPTGPTEANKHANKPQTKHRKETSRGRTARRRGGLCALVRRRERLLEHSYPLPTSAPRLAHIRAYSANAATARRTHTHAPTRHFAQAHNLRRVRCGGSHADGGDLPCEVRRAA